MKKIIIISIAIIATTLTSCVTTLHPLVSKETVTTDNRVIGSWTGNDGDILVQPFLSSDLHQKAVQENSVSILANEKTDNDAKFYVVSFERNNISYNMRASLVKLDGQLFMDLRPESSGGEGMDYSMDYMPAYSIAKVQIEDGKMILLFADGAFIKEQVVNDRLRIKHETDGLFGTFLITASTAELQQFIKKYADDARLFSSRNSVTLTRKG